MGLAIGDYDNDGRVDFHITNFSDDSNVLYHNDGDGLTDETYPAGLGSSPCHSLVGERLSWISITMVGRT